MDARTPRRFVATAEKRQRAMALIGPFTGQLQGWHSRLATITGHLLSRRSEPKLVQHDLDQLEREVESAYSAFKASVLNEARHSRVDDVDRAFRKLLHNVGAVRRSDESRVY